MKQNGVVCWPGPALLCFVFRFEYLISGPKSYRGFRVAGPWALRRTHLSGVGWGEQNSWWFDRVIAIEKLSGGEKKTKREG